MIYVTYSLCQTPSLPGCMWVNQSYDTDEGARALGCLGKPPAQRASEDSLGMLNTETQWQPEISVFNCCTLSAIVMAAHGSACCVVPNTCCHKEQAHLHRIKAWLPVATDVVVRQPCVAAVNCKRQETRHCKALGLWWQPAMHPKPFN